MVIERSTLKVQLKQVENGQEALDYLYRRESFLNPATSPYPDLLLLDLRMPRTDGLGVLDVVKKDPALKATPVVIVIEKYRSAAQHWGIDGYLAKPVDFEDFVNLIEGLCVTWLELSADHR